MLVNVICKRNRPTGRHLRVHDRVTTKRVERIVVRCGYAAFGFCHQAAVLRRSDFRSSVQKVNVCVPKDRGFSRSTRWVFTSPAPCVHYARMQGTRINARIPNRVRPREIGEADIPELVDLLARGYAFLPREFWQPIIAGLSRRSVPAGFPRYGYVIESDGRLVGAIILIFSTIWTDGKASIRCNGSSLYIDPAFRIYAPLLTSRALKDKGVTVLNITPAPHTLKMVEHLASPSTVTGRLPRSPFSAGILRLAAFKSSARMTSRMHRLIRMTVSCFWSMQSSAAQASGALRISKHTRSSFDLGRANAFRMLNWFIALALKTLSSLPGPSACILRENFNSWWFSTPMVHSLGCSANMLERGRGIFSGRIDHE